MLRNLLRRWLGITDPAPEPEPKTADSMSIDPSAMAYFGNQVVVKRPIKEPRLFPGVVPTNEKSPEFATDDACGSYYGGFGSETMAPIWAFAREAHCDLGFPGYAYLSELTQRTEYRAPSETIASEMTREWIVLKTSGKTGGEDDSSGKEADDAAVKDVSDIDPADNGGAEDKIEELMTALEEFGVRDMFRQIAEQDGFFGRSQLFIDIKPKDGIDDGKNRKLPLVVDPATIQKGSLRGFKVIEPIWTTPFSYNADDPAMSDFYEPRAWFILGKKVHASRLLTFISRPVPDILKPAYNFGGISLSQLMEPYVFQWLRTRNSVSDLVHNFSVMVLRTNMQAVLQGDSGSTGGLMDRVRLFVQSRDNQGLTVLDKETEELMQIAVPLSGLSDLQAQAQESMAGPSHIPLVKLLGITPTGLNASSEGEIKVFYDFIRASQQSLFAKHLKTVLDILQLHLFGSIDSAITFEFLPLTSPSVRELSDIRKSDAESGVRYIEAGVIDPQEERERLMVDSNSGYDNLSGDAPEPPDYSEFLEDDPNVSPIQSGTGGGGRSAAGFQAS